VPPLRTELDVRAFRDALTMMAEMTGQAVAICDEQGRVLYATARARRLVGSADIPAEILTLAGENDATAKVALAGTTHPVQARAQRLPGVARRFLVVLVEQAPRSTLAKSLVTRFGLSARAVQLVQLTSRGLTNREIAEQLRLSEATVKTYMHGLFRDVGVRNRAELVALAERMASAN
jgi:DNA-binding CsgD family transcriptional regulator